MNKQKEFKEHEAILCLVFYPGLHVFFGYKMPILASEELLKLNSPLSGNQYTSKGNYFSVNSTEVGAKS